jgi:hypothetical protein
MQESKKRGSSPRPAFHFPPLWGGNRRVIHFRVYTLLPQGGRVLLAETATWEDAEAAARMVRPGEGIETQISEVAPR